MNERRRSLPLVECEFADDAGRQSFWSNASGVENRFDLCTMMRGRHEAPPQCGGRHSNPA
ncbi:hypothetical protein SAMN05216551_10173 [Chitinasiproducens palmae]|uniref:Uncharacterized protein n=1 Tax=Chitinasiproducens palmae TaxID=1770053 RepID=A0A1H2PIT0_9BURK|nr:hypothetical protein SAMN05216551_10173 [Chitinasiproducens palmae]